MLSEVVEKVFDCAVSQADGRCEVVCDTVGVLELREVGGDFPRALPEDLQGLWARDVDKAGAPLQSADAEGGVEVPETPNFFDDGGKDDGFWSDDDEVEDYMACSQECGYCGRCKH